LGLDSLENFDYAISELSKIDSGKWYAMDKLEKILGFKENTIDNDSVQILYE